MAEQTIVAISTALGEAGIGIVRLSGPESLQIGDRMFTSSKGQKLQDTPTYRARYGKVVDKEKKKTIDEAIAIVMRGPKSYTGEDIVEIQCHGGVVVVKKVLELALECGAKLAEPGEFTKRAFLNGRLDLSQAEAVIDVVRSRTDQSLQVAVDQLEGSLSRRIMQIREELYDIVVRVEAVIDYPEDDIPDVELSEMESIISNTIAMLTELIATAEDGKIIREGIRTVITGKPNVGKSSLLNRLLDENRALVTDIPGTTRDTIEEVLNLRGIALRLIDTAGIRESHDVVEKLGVAKAIELWGQADLILHVLDRSVPLTDEDLQIIQGTRDKKRIIVVNKTDLPAVWSSEELSLEQDVPVVELSLLQGSMDSLIDTVIDYVASGVLERSASDSGIITRARHKTALIEAKTDLEQAQETLTAGLPLDLISVGLQGALEHLGAITGETVRDNIIERIFAQFCIGK